MNDEHWKSEVIDYINHTQWGILATVRPDNSPVLRVMGSFCADALNVYFSTRADAAKTEHIRQNNRVSFYFQQEGQELEGFKSVAVIGRAEQVEKTPELDHAVKLLGGRSPWFKARMESDDAKDFAIYKIVAAEIKLLDYSQGVGPEGVREWIL